MTSSKDDDDDDHFSRILPGVPAIDVQFQDIWYGIRQADSNDGIRHILHGLSGEFKSGELTAIMGPSGAGKTTLLNLLAGYTSNTIFDNKILVNGHARNTHQFRRMSTYIMQDDLIQSNLSVMEAMLVSAKLKNSCRSGANQEKDILIVLSTLGMSECVDIRTELLSGGQRKRLSIALELLSNPAVIFMDEPTTGLDNHSSKQMIETMKILTKQGRTVICTVHQPSPLEFQEFDHVYVIAQGCCVYSGHPTHLVPFLEGTGTPCPITYSPADYIIELVHSSPQCINILSASVIQAKLETKCDSKEPDYDTITFPSFFYQLRILLGRMLLQRWRNKPFLISQILHHVISSVLLGIVFYGIGNDAGSFLANFKFCLCVCVFFVYTYVLVPILNFPYDLELLKREHFNNWYNLLPFYSAYSLASMPGMFGNCIIFSLISYFMTNQPVELNRFVWFVLLSFFSGINSEGVGFIIGALFRIKNGSILGPAVVAPMFALSIYGMGYGTAVEPFMALIMKFTFMRHILMGFSSVLFGMGRPPLECDHFYCHYRDPQLFMRDIGVSGATIENAFVGVAIFTVLHRVLGFAAVKYRLKNDLAGESGMDTSNLINRVISYVRKKSTIY